MNHINDINALRDELFATIRALRDPNNPMDIARAKAVADVSQTIINSAKVEVDMINAIGARRIEPSGFIGNRPRDTLEQQDGKREAVLPEAAAAFLANPARNGLVPSL